jgi:hypothetical protein
VPATLASSEWVRVFEAASARGHRRTHLARGHDSRPQGALTRKRREQIAELLAESLAESSGVMIDVPVPIHVVAERLGFDVHVVNETFDGWMPDPHGFVIALRKSAPPNRLRFTLAHELAHAWLARHGRRFLGPQVSGTWPDRAAEERLCDSTAAALLLPRDRVRDILPSRPSMQNALRVSAVSQVSVSTLIARAAQLDVWRCALVRMRVEGDTLRGISVTGGPWRLLNWTVKRRLLEGVQPYRFLTLEVADMSGRPFTASCQVVPRGRQEPSLFIADVQ